tara:strand:- start:982 stop:1983 length:1002 start_codon:yes stop_codon:yes gene_type:complete
MGLPVTIYRWDDAGAPQLTNQTPSELIDILTKCLVDGYGAKQPLGWTIPFENLASQSVMFRNSIAHGGSGGVVRLSSVGGNASRTWLRMYASQDAVGIDNQINVGRKDMFGAPYSKYTAWILVGTPTAFFVIFCDPTGQMVSTSNIPEYTAYIGDFDNYLPADSGRFIAIAYADYSGDYTSASGSTSYGSTLSSLTRTCGNDYANYTTLKLTYADGTLGTDLYGLISWLNFNSSASSSIFSHTTPINIFLPFLVCLNKRITDTPLDPDGLPYRYSVKSPVIRGAIKGLTHEVIPRYVSADITWPHIENVNGKSQLLLRSTSQLLSMWINLEEW